jgi:hypothetical protein
MIASAINERVQRKQDYVHEEVRVLEEVVLATTGSARISFPAGQRRRLALAGKELSPQERRKYCQLVTPAALLAWFRSLGARLQGPRGLVAVEAIVGGPPGEDGRSGGVRRFRGECLAFEREGAHAGEVHASGESLGRDHSSTFSGLSGPSSVERVCSSSISKGRDVSFVECS